MASKRLLTTLFAAMALAVTATPHESVAVMPPERPWPALRTMSCPHQQGCDRSNWISFLAGLKLSELSSPAGGRAFRWLWVNQSPTTLGPFPSVGFVEVDLAQSGSGELRAGWCEGPMRIQAADIEPFEKALARTDFATLPEQDSNAANWVDYPPEQLLEADVGGKYHFVHRVGGIREAGVRDAGVLLEKLAHECAPDTNVGEARVDAGRGPPAGKRTLPYARSGWSWTLAEKCASCPTTAPPSRSALAGTSATSSVWPSRCAWTCLHDCHRSGAALIAWLPVYAGIAPRPEPRRQRRDVGRCGVSGGLTDVVVGHIGNDLRRCHRRRAPIPKWIKNEGVLATDVASPATLILMVVVAQRLQDLVAFPRHGRLAVDGVEPGRKPDLIVPERQNFGDPSGPSHLTLIPPFVLRQIPDDPIAGLGETPDLRLAAGERQDPILRARGHAVVVGQDVAPDSRHQSAS